METQETSLKYQAKCVFEQYGKLDVWVQSTEDDYERRDNDLYFYDPTNLVAVNVVGPDGWVEICEGFFTPHVSVEYEHDAREGYACVNYYVGEELVASDDGADTVFYLPEDHEFVKAVEAYWDEHGKHEPDWEAYNEELVDVQASDIREQHGDEYVILANAYESETSEGFANTYRLEDAYDGQESKHGWFQAVQVKNVPLCHNGVLVDWAKSKGLPVVENWFE